MVILSVYDKRFSIGGEKIKEPSIVQPGQALPMNKLIKGVINGSIVINSVPLEYDFAEKEVDVEEGKTPSATMAAANDAFVNVMQDQSSDFTNPTVAPGFDVNDAENIMSGIASAASQGTIEGGRGPVGDDDATKAGVEPVTDPDGSLSSGDEAVAHN